MRTKKKPARVVVESRSGVRGTLQLEYVRCGNPRCGRCSKVRPTHGPYWYLYTWVGGQWPRRGRLKSIYIGRELPPEEERRDSATDRALEKASMGPPPKWRKGRARRT